MTRNKDTVVKSTFCSKRKFHQTLRHSIIRRLVEQFTKHFHRSEIPFLSFRVPQFIIQMKYNTFTLIYLLIVWVRLVLIFCSVINIIISREINDIIFMNETTQSDR